MAVVALLVGLMAPAIESLAGTSGRRGALSILMSAIERARAAAIESGRPVYVGFADSDFPVEEMRYAAFIVFRDATDHERDPDADGDESDGVRYVILSNWRKLPRNVSFATARGSFLDPSSPMERFDGLPVPTRFSDTEFPVLKFLPTGAITGGSGRIPPLLLYEGFHLNGQDNFVGGASRLFDQISFSRFTGRAHLDTSSLGT